MLSALSEEKHSDLFNKSSAMDLLFPQSRIENGMLEQISMWKSPIRSAFALPATGTSLCKETGGVRSTPPESLFIPI